MTEITRKKAGKHVVLHLAAESAGSTKHDDEQPRVFGSVFDALANTPQESANMRARAQLARQITSAIKGKQWTQEIAAEHCGVTQPRINDLLNGRLSRFSLDALVNIASALGEVNVELRAPECA